LLEATGDGVLKMSGDRRFPVIHLFSMCNKVWGSCPFYTSLSIMATP